MDKAPRGLNSEIIPTLKMLRKADYKCHTVLGLRDIMDDAESTILDWKNKRIYSILDKYYSEIWVYGEQKLYDPIKEYRIPEHRITSYNVCYTKLLRYGVQFHPESILTPQGPRLLAHFLSAAGEPVGSR